VNDVDPALSTTPLLLIALAAVLILLFLIIRLRMHAFVALIVVSLGTALATRIPTDEIADVLVDGLGSTLGNVALLVGLGAMLGTLLERSGGAKVLADALVGRFGDERAPLALGCAALLFGLPIFFDAGLVVFLPIVFTVARRLGGSVLTYALPVAGAFAVMHAFVPPHPGPVAAAELIGAEIGLVLVFGLAIGLPTWFVGSYLFGTWIGRRIELAVPDTIGGGAGAGDDRDAGEPDADWPTPRLRTVLFLLLLPLVLIFLNTGLTTLDTAGTIDGDSSLVQTLVLIGQTPVALVITVVVAMWVLGWRHGRDKEEIESTVDSALGPVCSIILITGAGGMFGAVLQAGGVGDSLADALDGIGLPVIVAAFVIAVTLRVAQGSATVALTTTAGLIAPVIEATDGLSSADLALIVIAIAGGSTVLSHVNDSGFWLVGRFLGMDPKTTLRTWTVMETLLGTIGFVLAFALSLVL
jgi:gluconate:H+ symporter, GntP family